MSWFSIHNHTDVSNFRLRDSINKTGILIDYAFEKGLSGICITDHETLSNHIKAYKHALKNKEKFGDFKVGFGNEIYMVDKESTLIKKENNERIEFFHFIILAKNQRGYEALKKLSSAAWSGSFFYKGMERVPTYRETMEEIMKDYKGDVIASTACLGGELPKLLLAYNEERTPENKIKIHENISWLKNVFGEDVYFELQPSDNMEQTTVNKLLLEVGKAYGIKCIVSTDAHYLNKAKSKSHEIYLNASDGDREVAAFYATTYVMDYDELLEFFDKNVLDVLIKNTNEIKEKIQPITFEQEVKVPMAHIPDFTLDNLFEDYYGEYEYIKKFVDSKNIIDRYYIHLIAKGMKEKNQALNKENLDRINLELNEIYHISIKLKQPMSSYFVLTKELIEIMWRVSLVGVARGSASCYYTNYLLDIVQINPIKFKLPHWRFLSKERAELPDIDIDTESSKRLEIVTLVKEIYGSENVLNMGTFNTEAARSACLTACRGLGIDRDISQNISNSIPTEKGGTWTLTECFNGDVDSGKKPAHDFVSQVEKIDGLKETMQSIEGLISGRGQHASGIIIYPDGYIKQNAMMRTTNGFPVTQFDAIDSEFSGGLKYDFLSVTAMDRIRAAMDLLLEYGKIEWQGTLKATYNKYLHPDVLEMDDPKMYEMLYEGDVIDAFQFETVIGRQTIRKLNARTFDELVTANNLMRLSSQDKEQPLDKFIKHKNNIQSWYDDMRGARLTEDEIKTMERISSETYGVTESQEGLMLMIMDKEISGYDLTMANKFRKAIAKQDKEKILEQKILFYECGDGLGTSRNLLDYVWDYQFAPTFGYAFSRPHTAGYSLILMIEMNICLRYGPVFWKTACLSVNSGLIGEATNNTDYGSIAKAVGEMKSTILSPDINLSKMGFTPMEKEGKVLFGLKPIVGLGADAVERIIQKRPYDSYEDFHNKIVETGEISLKKAIALIKAGCFDSFEKDRRNLMINFVRLVVPKKDKLTMVQLPSVIQFADVEKFKDEKHLFHFRQLYFGRNKIRATDEMEKYFIQNFAKEVEYDFKNGSLEIDKKSFEKMYKIRIEPLKEWLNLPETIAIFNRLKMQEFWKENCSGTIESWEMETVLFYSDKHELDYIPLHTVFDLANFKELPYEPVIKGWNNYRGRKLPIFEISTISGTVVEKDKNKRAIHVLTKDGVVVIKFTKGQYAYYDKKIVRVVGKDKQILDPSWFERGTKLVFVGYRNGEQFTLRKTGTSYNHTVMKITGHDLERVYLQVTKVEE